ANRIVEHNPGVHDTLLVGKGIHLVALRERPGQEIFKRWRQVVAEYINDRMVFFEMIEFPEEGALRDNKPSIIEFYPKHVIGCHHRADVNHRPHLPPRVIPRPRIANDICKIDVTVHLIYLFIPSSHSPIPLFPNSLIHSFTPFTHSLIHSFTHSRFTHSPIHPFTHSLIHSFTHSLI